MGEAPTAGDGDDAESRAGRAIRLLHVFNQDFDTAMEIWLYQDPTVERLYCNEERAARRRSSFGSTQSQREYDYLSQSQSQSQSRRTTRKRKRRPTTTETTRYDAPPLPSRTATGLDVLSSQILTQLDVPETQPLKTHVDSALGSDGTPQSESDDFLALTRQPDCVVADSQQLFAVEDTPTVPVGSLGGIPEDKAHHRGLEAMTTEFADASKDLSLLDYRSKRDRGEVAASRFVNPIHRIHGTFQPSSELQDHASNRSLESVSSAFQNGTVKNLLDTTKRKHVHKSNLPPDNATMDTNQRAGDVSIATRTIDVIRNRSNDDSKSIAPRSASDATVVGMFQTGAGNAVRISKERLSIYEQKLRADEDAVERNSSVDGLDVGKQMIGGGASKDSLNNARRLASASTSDTTVAGMFQTGAGNIVRISKERLREFETRLRRDDDDDALDLQRRRTGGKESAVVDTFANNDTIQREDGDAVNSNYNRITNPNIESDSTSSSISSAHSGLHSGSITSISSLLRNDFGKNVAISATRLREYEADRGQDRGEMVPGGRIVTADIGDPMMISVYTKSGVASRTVPKSASETVVAGLFQTGSGKSVHVSATRLRDYEEKLRNNQEALELDRQDGGVRGDTDGKNANSKDGARFAVKSPLPHSASTTMVTGLFQTGSGKNVQISKSRLRDYEKKLREDDDNSSSGGGVPAASEFADSVAAAGRNNSDGVDTSRHEESNAVVTGLFQTGNGKSVLISKARLQAYKEKIDEDSDATELGGHVGIVSSGGGTTDKNSSTTARSSHPAQSASEATVTGLFQTGSGKKVLVSKARLRDYENKLREDEAVMASDEHERGVKGIDSMKDDTSVTPHAVSDSVVTGLFQTGSGKSVPVSKARLLEFEQKLLRDENTTEMDRQTGDDAGGGHAPIGGYSEERVKIDGAHPTVVSSDGTVTTKKIANGPTSTTPDIPFADAAKVRLNGDQSTLNTLSRRPPTAPMQNNEARHEHPGRSAIPLVPKQLQDKRKLIARVKGGPQEAKENQIVGIVPHSEAITAPLQDRTSVRRGLGNAMVKLDKALVVESTLSKPEQHDTVPLKPGLGAKRKFRPPLPRARPSGINVNRAVVRPEVTLPVANSAHASKKQKTSPPISNQFHFRELMKVSFTHLLGMRSDRDLFSHDLKSSHDPRTQVLSTISAANAGNVLFGARDGDAHPVLLRSSIDEPYDAQQLVGPMEIYDHMIVADFIKVSSGATPVWFSNHYRWIVWKLAAMELSFPNFLSGKYLTRDQVTYQISRRFQRELVCVERPILKKVLQRDASSLSCMVLCIASVLPFPVRQDEPDGLQLPAHWKMALVLTDGWYAIYAAPDATLAEVLWKQHAKSSIVGTKIVVWNAALRNSTEGVDPLECAITREAWRNPLEVKDDLTQWPYLALNYNSTRRVHYGSRLGEEQLRCELAPSKNPSTRHLRTDFTMLKSVPLRSLVVGGGMVRSVRVVVKRVCPVLHLQGKDWTIGPRVLCEEHLHTYFELRSRISRDAMPRNGYEGDEQNGGAESNIEMPVPFVKMEVECSHGQSHADLTDCAALTYWRPAEELLFGVVREGDEYFVSNLTVNWKIDANRSQGAFLRLSSTKGTTFEKVQDEGSRRNLGPVGDGWSGRRCVSISDAISRFIADESNGKIYQEKRVAVDVCVFVVYVTRREEIEGARRAGQSGGQANTATNRLPPGVREAFFSQHVFVTDNSNRLMSVRIASTEVRMGGNSSAKSTRASSVFSFRRGGASVWKEGSIVCLSGVEVSHYDDKLRILDCHLLEGTQVISFPSAKSHFRGDYSRLQEMARTSEFMTRVAKLREYVERRIIGLENVVLSQDVCNDEAERLTQDMRSQNETDEVDTANDATLAVAADPELVEWTANIAKLLPVPRDKQVCESEMAALAMLVLLGKPTLDSNDAASVRAVYLSADQLRDIQASLLQQSGGANSTVDTHPQSEDRSMLLKDTSRLLREHPAIFRFRVRCATSERLLNSWKPWESLNASYWTATTISVSGDGATNMEF